RTLLFAGVGATNLNDLWSWDGTVWTQLTSGSSPPPVRRSTAMAFDQSRGRAVVFGGSGGGFLSDTWEWDGTMWSNPTLATHPVARDGLALAYDVTRARTVLFGGEGAMGGLQDTWEWDGTSWTQQCVLAPCNNAVPSMRAFFALAWDAVQG